MPGPDLRVPTASLPEDNADLQGPHVIGANSGEALVIGSQPVEGQMRV